MLQDYKITRLATLLVEARRGVHRLDAVPADLMPQDAAEADAVQDATAALLGPVGGFKVFQVAAGPGSWGAIYAADIHPSPAHISCPANALKVEAEIAFRIGGDLPGRADGRPYTADEVAAHIATAFPAFELVDSRLPSEPKPAALAARADAMSNFGLVTGTEVADWRPLVRDDLFVSLDIDGRRVVAQVGGHPSGDPFHPMVWLANALAARGRGLVAGQVVTTGAFGGSHFLRDGEVAIASIAGFAPISFEATA